jgi:hypothetical protein
MHDLEQQLMPPALLVLRIEIHNKRHGYWSHVADGVVGGTRSEGLGEAWFAGCGGGVVGGEGGGEVGEVG